VVNHNNLWMIITTYLFLTSLSLWMTYVPSLGDDILDAFQVLMDDFMVRVSLMIIDLPSKCSFYIFLVYFLNELTINVFIQVVIVHVTLYYS
jgi:hypothetical protein